MATALKPSRLLRQRIAAAGGVWKAAREWGVWPNILHCFVNKGTGISGNTIAQLIEATGLPYDALFEHQKDKP